MFRGAGAQIPEDSRGRTRLLSALLWSLSAVVVCVAGFVGGTKPAIVTAVVCLVLLVGSSVAIGLRSGNDPPPHDAAVPPDAES